MLAAASLVLAAVFNALAVIPVLLWHRAVKVAPVKLHLLGRVFWAPVVKALVVSAEVLRLVTIVVYLVIVVAGEFSYGPAVVTCTVHIVVQVRTGASYFKVSCAPPVEVGISSGQIGC